MEIIIGIIASVLLELFKKMSLKFGKDVTSEFIYSFLFVVAIIWSIVARDPSLMAMAHTVVATIAASIATYETILSKIGFLLPAPPTPPEAPQQ